MTAIKYTDRQIKAMLASNQLPALRQAGFSASALRQAGFSASALLQAGFRASALLQAGFSASALLQAGFSASDVQELEDSIPTVKHPYTKIAKAIANGAIKHDQSTFGPDSDPKTNLCKTAMCTAGHLINMGGAAGYALKDKYGFSVAAALIHYKAHPDWPCQDFGNIRQDFALAYIEEMAEREANEAKE